jgi:EpsI family protein
MTSSRRHALIGLACLGAAGTAYALKPRHRLSLASARKLEDVIPRSFAGWSERPAEALIRPEDEDELAARLYSEVVGRVYVHHTGPVVMLLIAYGNTQNDLLQLHRPEVCYPAFGFEIEGNRKVDIVLGADTAIPARALVAVGAQRIEQILYWTRIGEHLPTDNSEQRLAKLEDQFAGIIPDGVLVRISIVGSDPDEALAINRRFATEMVRAISAGDRRVLIGSAMAKTLAMVRFEAGSGKDG